MSDKEIVERAAEIQRARARAYEADCNARRRKAAQIQEDANRQFAERVGVTWEQFEEIESYVRNVVWEEQR
jgi:hypothetical protein